LTAARRLLLSSESMLLAGARHLLTDRMTFS
jgi:hypothetical protein